MKLNDPRCVLLAGLMLALSVNVSYTVQGADAKPRPLLMAQVQPGPILTPVPAAPIPGLPDLSTTPFTPPPSSLLDNSNLAPQPQSSSVPSTVVPTPPTPQPEVNNVPRQPLGIFHGEQDLLDAKANPPPRPLPSVPYPGAQSSNQMAPGAVQGTPASGAPSDGSPQISGTDRFGFAPPPGTLGQTYRRRSRLIDDKKHPRVGIVEVNLPEGVDVSSIGLKTKWTGKVWRLESDPLLPGVPHIYEIKASWGEGTDPQYRTVRLIMGRIVDLDF